MKLYKWYLISLMLLFSYCKPKAPPDPCKGMHATTANFTIEEVPWGDPGWIPYSTDTICTSEISFTANEVNASYEWHIGAGVYTTKSFSLNFANATDGSTIPIELIVHKQPNLSCFPADKGIDTVTTNMYFDRRLIPIVDGTYFGYNTNNPSDTFTIGIKIGHDSVITQPGVYINNLIRGHNIFCGTEVGYKEILFEGIVSGDAILTSSNNNISISYKIFDSIHNTWPKTSSTFLGKRVK